MSEIRKKQNLEKWFHDPIDVPCLYCKAAREIWQLMEDTKADEDRLLMEDTKADEDRLLTPESRRAFLTLPIEERRKIWFLLISSG